MIMIWNQKEIFVGDSLKKFNEVRHILAASKIEYKYRVVNHKSPYLFSSRRARIGTFGENMDYLNLYYIYVHKKDYYNACAALKNSKW